VSNPANPQRVGGYDTSGYAYGVAVSGNYAYVADYNAGLQVIDVSNPANPRRVGGYDTSGYAYGVAVSGNYAYVADYYAGLQVIDVSDPANPRRVGGYYTSGYAEGVALSGNYAYLADGDAGLQVIEVSDPANPRRVGGYYTSGYAEGVAVSGNYAYVADFAAGLQVIDVSDPANPRRVGGYDTIGYAQGVAISGNYAYLAVPDAGLQVIDVSDPANPRWVGGYDTSGFARGVAVSGHYAYVADEKAGLQVIDVSDPANPRRVGGYDTPDRAFGVAVSGYYAYVADYDAGLQVIDVSDPANPRRVGGYETTGYAFGVAVSSHYAYVADWYGGLQVIDVSDPANPRRVGGLDTGRAARGVAVSGNYAYVANAGGSLQVIDVSNPANPHEVGLCATSWYAEGVAASGNYAYVANYDAGLQVIDVSDPANPRRVGGYDTPGQAEGVAVSGNYAYVADGDWGLQILRVGTGLPLPDLTVAGLSVSKATVRPGDRVTVTFTVQNMGNASAPVTPARIRLASGPNVTTTDPLLSQVNVHALGPGESATMSVMVTIPPWTSPGNYYLGVTANATGPVAESNPNNNQRVTPITVEAGQATVIATTATGFVYPLGRAGPYAPNMPGWLAGGPGYGSYRIGYYHLGQDMEANPGEPVYAIAGGEIVWVSTAGWGTGNYGLLVRHRLADGSEFIAVYGHVRPVRPELQYSATGAVSPPLPVRAGDVFATVGPADNVAYRDTHLHLGIRPGGAVPPAPFGMMPLANWPAVNGFVDPMAWITTRTPQDGAGQPPATAPATPRSLTAQVVVASPAKVELGWQAGSADATGFYLERKDGPSGIWTQIATVAGNARQFIDNLVELGRVYYYRIRAWNAVGVSDYSGEASVTMPQANALVPVISGVEPAQPLATGSPQKFTIRGANFAANSTVNLRCFDGTPGGRLYENRLVSDRSDTHITINPNFGSVPCQWSVEVVNPGLAPVSHGFRVVSDPGPSEDVPWDWPGKWSRDQYRWLASPYHSSRLLNGWDEFMSDKSKPVDAIVIHTTMIITNLIPPSESGIVQAYQSATNHFLSNSEGVSAHYVVGPNGELTQNGTIR